MNTFRNSLLFMVAGGSLLFAQETPRFTFDAGAGFVESVGSTRTQLDKTGWNIDGGAGVNIAHGLGVKLDLGYTYFGLNSATLSSLGVPNGDVGIFTALVNPVYHIHGFHHIDTYVFGGGGLFHQNEEFTAPIFGTTTLSNPFFGINPVSTAGQEIFSSYSVTKPGYDVGAGIELGTRWHGKVFAEARYDHMFNTDSHTDFIPVTFGFRW
jgi:Outer membrane protein beta-barrel domain